MKKYFLLVGLFMASIAAKAQDGNLPDKFTAGIDVGLALPSSDFASASSAIENGQNTINGSANTGFYYDAYCGYKVIKFLGIMAQYGRNSNSYNTSNLTSGSSASGGYTSAEYLIGPFISFKIAKIKIEAKLLGGMLTSNYPTLTIQNYGYSTIDAFENGKGFGYCAGAKVKYMLFDGLLGVGIGFNYVSSDITYSNWTQTYSGTYPLGFQPTLNGSTKMSLGLVQLTAGLSLDI